MSNINFQIVETMLLSGAEMEYFLDRTTTHIEFPNHYQQHKKITRDRYERSFAELLCMNSSDMVFGYRTKREVKAKAVKLHSKLISSVILSILINHKSGYQRTNQEVLSWDYLNKEKLWVKVGIKIGTREIRRLDWVIHELIVSDGESTQRWIKSIPRWEAFLITDEEYESSDNEYGDDHKIMPNIKKNINERQRNVPSRRLKKCILC